MRVIRHAVALFVALVVALLTGPLAWAATAQAATPCGNVAARGNFSPAETLRAAETSRPHSGKRLHAEKDIRDNGPMVDLPSRLVPDNSNKRRRRGMRERRSGGR